LVTTRAQHTATLLADGKVLVVGGYSSGAEPDPLATAELYDPGSGSWTATGEMIEGRWGHTATLLPDGRVLVTGGAPGNDLLASAELYDPGSGSWAATADMIEGRGGHTATLLPDGRLLVTGGTGDGVLASAELYDPGRGSWTATTRMAEARLSHTATLLPDGRVLVAGGCCRGPVPEDFDSLASAELYDPVSGSWTATGGLIEPRDSHSATLLPDGKVLVAGGSRSSHVPIPVASVELYDPGSGSWTATGNMIGARQGTATLLLDGRVLAAGDSGYVQADGGYVQVSAELYDPGTGSWSATGKMIEARTYDHTATLLPDGRVLVAGGSDGSRGLVLASTELYD
jgi:N-acetylneuraminic acid mutarotase